jgi:hypothetical protein
MRRVRNLRNHFTLARVRIRSGVDSQRCSPKDKSRHRPGDIEPLRKTARALARQYGLNTADADQFYQLALETMGPCSHAEAIYRAVKAVR